jgi:hypothetical protein
MQLYRYFVNQSSEFFRYNPLCVASKRAFVVVVAVVVVAAAAAYYVINSVWKLLGSPSYNVRRERLPFI